MVCNIYSVALLLKAPLDETIDVFEAANIVKCKKFRVFDFRFDKKE